MSKRSVAVQIAGQEYRIRSDADADALHQIARYVDHAMGRVRERTGTVDSLDVAVLTCLNLAREIRTLREQRAAGAEDEKLRDLIERVESVLGHAPEAADSGETQPSAEEQVTVGATPAEESATHEPPRTLELPSVDVLREQSEPVEPPVAAEPRVAAGGSDRAS
ncbi:MAG: cell division protein ZapA [Deltaproteobacteria bacterium]|jgi:cell division protein ZapA (FtsZ GTPase activity inhibitor)|nr:cell division protein ZapA [Deltaproteobacteria bacterium]